MTEEKKTEETTAIAERKTAQIMRPIAGVQELIDRHKAITDIVGRVLVKGTDYGVIPGTGTKPTLYQPGAERLLIAFGCICEHEITNREMDHNQIVRWTKRRKKWGQRRGDYTWEVESGESIGVYSFEVKAIIRNRATGEAVGSSIACASTMESKYVDRPRECANTVLKMAQKRAMVSAVKEAFGLSDRFTVDLDDQQNQDSDPETERVEPEYPALTASSLWAKAQAKGMDRDEWTNLCAVHGLEKANARDPGALERMARAVDAYQQKGAKASSPTEAERLAAEPASEPPPTAKRGRPARIHVQDRTPAAVSSLPEGVEDAPANADEWAKGRE